MVLMKAASVTTQTPRPGRPRTSTLSRAEQVRTAKRTQREREQGTGMQIVPLKLRERDALRLRAAMPQPEFAARIADLLDDMVVDVTAYENLAQLCWNRRTRFIAAQDTFSLYERNWRLVDRHSMKPTERALIERLTARFGNGVLNA
jgi:hypothetical protein